MIHENYQGFIPNVTHRDGSAFSKQMNRAAGGQKKPHVQRNHGDERGDLEGQENAYAEGRLGGPQRFPHHLDQG